MEETTKVRADVIEQVGKLDSEAARDETKSVSLSLILSTELYNGITNGNQAITCN